MYASTMWLNDYLDPPATAEEQAELLTRAGFPLEGRDDVDGDVCQDFEMTSNRGDCVCHVGLAREVSAISGRRLKLPRPAVPAKARKKASDIVAVMNEEPVLCPLYTARIMKGVTVRSSPEWLQQRLRAIGQIPRNNIVDATNFVLFELGQPTHVFDLDKLKGPKIIVRRAHKDEPFLPIGEGQHDVKLRERDLVIADTEDAVAIGGVKGGALTAVTEATKDILIEAATFNPVAVRNTSRQLGISSDSSYRYERGVHPAHINPAADRLVEILLDVAGGELCAGVVSDGAPIPDPVKVTMRFDRCRRLMGVPLTDEEMIQSLTQLGFQPVRDGDRVTCAVPVHRLDIEREVDLIEEVGRMFGHDRIPIEDTISITVAAPQASELARHAIDDALVGMGFLQTVTHSLVNERAAETFLPNGCESLRVDDERARAAPVLRPSVIASLMEVRQHNQDQGNRDLRLYESASIFFRNRGGHIERQRLGLLIDLPAKSADLREMRGVIERLIAILLGDDVTLEVRVDDRYAWVRDGAGATISVRGESIGWMGIVDDAVTGMFDLETLVAAAEIEIRPYYDSYPPEKEVSALPEYPAIERDITVVLAEATPYAAVESTVAKQSLDMLETIDFVTTYRGRQLSQGKKAITIRLRFRAGDRTLKHDEVDPQVERVMAVLESSLDGEIRR